MEKITSAKLAQILGCTADKIVDVVIDNVSTDSRKITPTSLFIALKGERFDAHNFVKEVISAGCPLVVVERLLDDVPSERQLVVEDTLQAFGKIGAYNRSLFTGTVIGLTGSAGKTTTKEEIAFLLSKFAPVYATGGNHNNAVGVPQSLCEMDMKASYAVIEMGMSAKGEISYLTNLVKPDIAVITNVYPMHIEFFENFEGIAGAKAEIFESMSKNGVAVINEDTNFASLLKETAFKYTHNIKTFGKNNHPQAKFTTQEEGEQYEYNAWCALRVVEILGLDVQKAASYIKDFGALEGRGKRHTLSLSDGSYTLIDDSYSGQPEAMIMAINNLSKMQTKGRKIAVLGKMAELGETSRERHKEVGRVLAQSNVDIVVGVCPETKDMLAQLPVDKEQYYFASKDGIAEFLLNKLLQNGDTILIKGARYSSQVYKITEELIKRGEMQ
ncbi:MAG: UDP-N-acetylmuramoyl-tripeptide--D-alanyl-D-alanine ligase [Alphaproteobacteria bacterium]|nr:UDP-N-acetylmuramoyl-tripeptide--D-alanyl-D-alanine ligase [Alphaproteobacteria bacterium]